MMIIKYKGLNKELDWVEFRQDLYESPEGETMTCSPALTVSWKKNIHFLASLAVCSRSQCLLFMHLFECLISYMPLTLTLFRAIKNLSCPSKCWLCTIPNSRRFLQVQCVHSFWATEHVDLEAGTQKGKPEQGRAGGTKITFVVFIYWYLKGIMYIKMFWILRKQPTWSSS